MVGWTDRQTEIYRVMDRTRDGWMEVRMVLYKYIYLYYIFIYFIFILI